MPTQEPAIMALVEELVTLLHQQHKMLRQNKWPSFMVLKEQSDRLLDQATQHRHDLRLVPQALQEQLQQAYQQMEWILVAQKHLVREELKLLRQKKPAVKAYHRWSHTKQKNSRMAAM